MVIGRAGTCCCYAGDLADVCLRILACCPMHVCLAMFRAHQSVVNRSRRGSSLSCRRALWFIEAHFCTCCLRYYAGDPPCVFGYGHSFGAGFVSRVRRLVNLSLPRQFLSCRSAVVVYPKLARATHPLRDPSNALCGHSLEWVAFFAYDPWTQSAVSRSLSRQFFKLPTERSIEACTLLLRYCWGPSKAVIRLCFKVLW